ncbi:hypothetical protein Slin15195_G042840 [Septoria linicola]|uniref:Glycosyltransferase family 31 protein n=1 Tax=Septoria linicola TaxID=215465 RepID=A0A9Q9AR02_9PEZI|nr:hypothetical protein Slin14017_G046360 [Septoria linicola]USW50965.1 hypothetical protein Slin15195_G042840 [Septoria linicola]
MVLSKVLDGLRLPRPLIAVVSAVLLVLFFGGFWTTQHESILSRPGFAPSDSRLSPCASTTELKAHISLPDSFQYGRRIVRSRATKKSTNRKDLERQKGSLMPQFVTLSEEQCSSSDEGVFPYDASKDGREIVLDFFPNVPLEIDQSVLLVGASTSLDRLEQALAQLKQWLGNTKTSLVVNVADSDERQRDMSRVQSLYRTAGIDATLLPNADRPKQGEETDRHGHRHFSVVKQLHSQRKSHHKWFAVVDDDTFFPSLAAVLAELKKYDSSQPYYIGGLTEDWHALSGKYGYMAYGGAGMFLSGPLLDTLVKNFDQCLPKHKGDIQGDMVFRDCIYRHTSPPVQLTALPGLHQVDFRGDASGWYEAGVEPLLSLHHWSSVWWYLYPVHLGSLVSHVCGTQCFLQRYRFADDVVLTNGYSVAQYPDGADNVDFGRVEATFMHDTKDREQWDFSLGKLRPRMSADEKITWRLEHAIEEKDGTVRQFYIRRAGDEAFDSGRVKQKVVGVFEIEWKT